MVDQQFELSEELEAMRLREQQMQQEALLAQQVGQAAQDCRIGMNHWLLSYFFYMQRLIIRFFPRRQ